jgi:uncharacterized membrane protein YiaA
MNMNVLGQVETTVDERPRDPDRVRRTGWMMALSPVLFVGWVAAVVVTMSGSGVSQAADLTRDQLDAIRLGWLMAWPLYGVAVVGGAVGLAALNRYLRAGWLTAASQAALGLAVAAVVICAVLHEVALGFTEPRLGDNGAYSASLVFSYLAVWAMTLAVVLTGLAARSTGVLRRTGLVVAVVAAVLLVLDLVTRALPPWFVAFYLLAFGIGLLRRPVLSGA